MKTSQSIKEISSALCNAQLEIKNTAKTVENPFFKSQYAPLDCILDEIRPVFNKHGISILHDISSSGNMMIVSVIFLHKSGEWIQQDGMPLPIEKNTAQSAGATATYGRRYTLQAFTGTASEDDTDGNIEPNKKNKLENKNTNPETKPTAEKLAAQYHKFYGTIKEDLRLHIEELYKTTKQRFDLFDKCKWDIAIIDAEITRQLQEVKS